MPSSPKPPTEKQIAARLGDIYSIWSEFLEFLETEFAPIEYEWKETKSTWSCRPMRKARRICYLTPEDGKFMAAFALGEKAVAAARASKLPKSIIAEIENAKPYAEGRGIRIVVSRPSQLAHLKTLASVKMSN
ncbi:MAG: DUF3788 family protein [bacterium]|nr:DUF3788 family protein [bacterium]